jgi:hypothetical protein
MVSETDPYLWATTAALFAGLAVGQAVRCLSLSGASPSETGRARARRTARALTYISLAILAVAGLLVLSDKAALARALGSAALGTGNKGGAFFGSGALLPWAALVAAIALAVGLFPRAAGIPAAAVCLAGLVLLRLALMGWLSLPAAPAEGHYKIAHLLPYEVGPASFLGHLEMPALDSAPASRELSLRASAVALSAESLELAGPLAFLGGLADPPKAAGSVVLRLYRISAVSAPGGIAESFPLPAYSLLLDVFLSLPPGAGIAPGGAAVSRTTAFGLARRSRATSAAIGLAALEPVNFGLILDPLGITAAY